MTLIWWASFITLFFRHGLEKNNQQLLKLITISILYKYSIMLLCNCIRTFSKGKSYKIRYQTWHKKSWLTLYFWTVLQMFTYLVETMCQAWAFESLVVSLSRGTLRRDFWASKKLAKSVKFRRKKAYKVDKVEIIGPTECQRLEVSAQDFTLDTYLWNLAGAISGYLFGAFFVGIVAAILALHTLETVIR